MGAKKITITQPRGPPVEVLSMTIGSIRVTRLPSLPGKLWLTNEIGEGMGTDEAKLGAALKRYFLKEF